MWADGLLCGRTDFSSPTTALCTGPGFSGADAESVHLDLSTLLSFDASEGDQRLPTPPSSMALSSGMDVDMAISLLHTLPGSDAAEPPAPLALDEALFDGLSCPSRPLQPGQQGLFASAAPAAASAVEVAAASPPSPAVPSPTSIAEVGEVTHQTSSEYEAAAESFRIALQEEPRADVEPALLLFHPAHEVPDRINATSPSRLATRARPGANFTVAVLLLGRCPRTGGWVRAAAPRDMRLRAQIWAKRRLPKKARQQRAAAAREFVPLSANPEGAPLLVCGSQAALACEGGHVDVRLRAGTAEASFEQLSLTCGSNAARSSKASAAARAWDWEYHMLVSEVRQEGAAAVPALMSRHITTDSNRSLTREKRRPDESSESSPVPPPSKRTCAQAPSCDASPHALQWLPTAVRSGA